MAEAAGEEGPGGVRSPASISCLPGYILGQRTQNERVKLFFVGMLFQAFLWMLFLAAILASLFKLGIVQPDSALTGFRLGTIGTWDSCHMCLVSRAINFRELKVTDLDPTTFQSNPQDQPGVPTSLGR